MYEHALGAALLAERAAESAYRWHSILTELGTLAQASKDVLPSFQHPDTSLQHSFGEFLDFMRSTFHRKRELQEEQNRAL